MKWIIIALVICFGFLQYRLWVGEGSIAEVVNLNQQITLQQSEIERLQEQNRVLALEVSELKTGVRTLESRARTEMGMIKEGETFILVLDDEQKPRNSKSKIAPQNPNKLTPSSTASE
ncbi:septum formation initiator family protein [Aurantivibrio infirmus]